MVGGRIIWIPSGYQRFTRQHFHISPLKISTCLQDYLFNIHIRLIWYSTSWECSRVNFSSNSFATSFFTTFSNSRIKCLSAGKTHRGIIASYNSTQPGATNILHRFIRWYWFLPHESWICVLMLIIFCGQTGLWISAAATERNPHVLERLF